MPGREIKIAILGDPSSLQSALRSADSGVTRFGQRMQQVGSRMRSVGSSLSRSLTLPIVGFGILAARELSAGERALAQTQAVIESTGGAAQRSVDDIVALSASLSELTSLDDEPIQEAANTLLTFQNVVGETFDEATAATLDLSVAMDRDLRSSAVLVGRALNNPIKGLTALTRVGVDFDSQFEDTNYTMAEAITYFMEMGDTAKAQQIILGELNEEFGGSAEALGGTLTGRLNRVKNRMEAMGAAILEDLLPAFEDLADLVEGLADSYDRLTPTQQKVVAAMVAFAAVAGPLSSVIGILTTALGGMAAALGVSVGWIALIIAAIAALGIAIYMLVQNWDTVKLAMTNFFTNLLNNVPGARGALNGLQVAIQAVRTVLGTIAGAAQAAMNALGALGSVVLDGLIGAFNGVLSLIQACVNSVLALIDAIGSAASAAASLPGRVIDAIPGRSVGGGKPTPRGSAMSSEDVVYRAFRRAMRDEIQLVKAV